MMSSAVSQARGPAQPTAALAEANAPWTQGQFDQAAHEFQRIVEAGGGLEAHLGLARFLARCNVEAYGQDGTVVAHRPR